MKSVSLKLFAALLIATPFYWHQIPATIITLMWMAGFDLLMGTIVAVVKGQFKARLLLAGILIKASYFILLGACHQVEGPLQLSVHLEKYVADTLIAYEFISLIENYSKIRPLPRILVVAVKKYQYFLESEYLKSDGETKTEKSVETVVVRPSLDVPSPPAVVETTTVKETSTKKA